MTTLGVVLRLLFWASGGLVLYTYIIYPLILVLLAGLAQVWTDIRYALGREERRRSRSHTPRSD